MKMAAEVRWLQVILIISLINCLIAENVHRRFEYKYSFKPPYLAQRDGTVPFWEYGGNAIASSENVRVTPSLRSQKGAIWSKRPVNFDWWEVELIFRVSSRGRIGADGLAFWYTTQQGAYDGPVFGSSDKWNGLGVFFDSFDNDNKHNNPYIMAVLNDGTKEFDHANDGTTQLLSGCLRDFRNKPFPTRAKIEYYKNVLTVYFHGGMTKNDEDYELCFRVENVILPRSAHFGISAATGGLADDHDVLQVLTTSLHPSDQMTYDGRTVSVEEKEKIAKEYQDYQKKLDEQKEEYKRAHPDEVREDKDFDEWLETDNQRELRQIFEGQSQIFEILREINRKSGEILGTQTSALSLLSQLQVSGIQAGIGGQPVQPGQPSQPIQLIDTIRRQEVELVINNLNMMSNAIREVKSLVGDVNSRAEAILTRQDRGPTAQVQPIGYDYQALISEMRDGINHIKRDVSATFNKVNAAGGGTPDGCPTINCLTTTMFLIFLVVQLIIIIGYNLYRDNKEAQAKKFY